MISSAAELAFPMACTECGRELLNVRSAGSHLGRSHPGVTLEHLVLERRGGNKPTCACGCGVPAPWLPGECRFGDYVRGHNRRCRPIDVAYGGLCDVGLPRSLDRLISDIEAGRKLADREAIVSREKLIRLNELPGGRGRRFTEYEILPRLVSLLQAHVAAHGWFYPEAEQSVEEVLSAVRAARSSASGFDGISLTSSAGVRLLKAMFPSFWDVIGGPVEAFRDPSRIRRAVAYRVGLNSSRLYRYTLSDGSDVSCREHFDVTLADVRRAFVVQRSSFSFFKPVAARDVWMALLGDAHSPRVWDPSGGFGARMLGFAAAYPCGEYICCEPASRTAADLEALGAAISSVLKEFRFAVLRSGSEVADVRLTEASFDAAFTSPPYFDLEKYYDEPGQCWRDYPNEHAWKARYLRPTVENAFRILKDGGELLVNFDATNAARLREVAYSAGAQIVSEHDVNVGADHFSKRRGSSSHRKEKLLRLRRA